MVEQLLDFATFTNEVDADPEAPQRPVALREESSEPGMIRERDRNLGSGRAVGRRDRLHQRWANHFGAWFVGFVRFGIPCCSPRTYVVEG